MARDISSRRLSRILELMSKFISRNFVTKEELLREMGYSNDKALQRDLDFLRYEAGFHICYDRRGSRYFLGERDANMVVNCPLSESEFIALVSGISLAGHFIPFLEKSCSSLRNKISNLVPERAKPKGETLARSSTVALPVSGMDAHVFRQVVNAMHNRQCLKIQYRSPYGRNPSARRHLVSPWFIYFRYRAWYLWGKSDLYPQSCAFRISRILLAEPATEGFQEPPAGMTLEDVVHNGECPGERVYKVKLRIHEPFASSVVDVQDWYPRQEIRRSTVGGSILFSAEVRDLTDISRWILSAADCVEVLSPVELRGLVRKKALVLLGRMEKSSEKPGGVG